MTRTKSVVATYLEAEARLQQSNRERFRRGVAPNWSGSGRLWDDGGAESNAVALINSIDAGARIDDGATDTSSKSAVMLTVQKV